MNNLGKMTRIGCCVLLLGSACAFAAKPKKITTESNVAMIEIPAGEFVMGTASGALDETAHKVQVSGFYMDAYEVTQADFVKVMADNPSKKLKAQNPVEQVTWAGAAKYCNARSKLEGLKPCYDTETWKCDFTADGYRLPTEAEWEYACRAGQKASYFFGKNPKKLRYFAWTADTANGQPREVGKRMPNPWGLYDMYGNIAEWCNDYYAADYYKASSAKDPKGPDAGEKRVVRGGSWNSSAEECRSACRMKENPGYADVCIASYDVYGFRCVKKMP